ncbi:MAG: hypothetical protein P1U58_18005 [Verrucomicrobiales bacterium]|nr:hypothetical protein [Verrucomicrobiales bacterium]
MKKYILLCLALILPNTSFGQWIDKDGKTLPNCEWRKSKQNFSSMLLLSSKPKEFLKSWDKPVDAVPIHTTDETTKDKPITIFILFLESSANAAGLCNSVVDYTITKPDGNVYARIKDAELWKNKKPMQKGKLGLGVDYLEIKIEPKDPLGVYTVRATVKDLNANITLDLKRTFMVLKSNK